MSIPRYTKTYHSDSYASISAQRPAQSARGKRIVITGGGGGIGAATAAGFAVAGACEVVILGRTMASLQSTKESIETRHPHTAVIPIVADVSDAKTLGAAFDAIAKRGAIDVYINNAGYLAEHSAIADANVADWWLSFEVHVKAAVVALQAVAKNIAPDGVVINLISGACHVPFVPGFSAYATSKLAAARVFEYFQHEHPHLRVYNVQPGMVASTAMAKKNAAQRGSETPHSDSSEFWQDFAGEGS